MEMLFSSYQFTPYSLVMAVVTAIELVIVFFTWRRRATTGARYLMWLFVAMAESSCAYIFLYASSSPSVLSLWYQIANLGFAVAGPLYLLFGLEYTQMGQHINGRLLLLLAILPAVTVLLTWTNPLHHLIFSAFSLNPINGLGVLEGSGAWSIVQLGYTYLCVLITTFLLLRAMTRFPPFFRAQAGIIAAAAVPPVFGSLVELFNNPMPGFDWHVLGYGLSGILLAVVIRRQYMFNLVPLARAQIIDSMADGVVVLDTADLIVDINLSARHLLKFIGGALIGQPARKVLPIWPEIERGQDAVITIPDATTTSKAPLAVRHIDTHVTPLLDQHKRVIGRMFILRDVTLIQQQKAEIQALQDRLRAEAIHDELTGLYNRHYFGEALALGLAQARRDNLPFSLVILDVDHFKEINEARGDAAGDLLLQQAANLLTRSTRGGDVICRYGGDEFALLLPNTSLEDAFSCAERWRHGMEKLGALDGTQGALFQFTVSLGMAGYPNCEGSMDELLAVADQALYTAKKSGRNRTVLWRQAPVNPSDAPTP